MSGTLIIPADENGSLKAQLSGDSFAIWPAVPPRLQRPSSPLSAQYIREITKRPGSFPVRVNLTLESGGQLPLDVTSAASHFVRPDRFVSIELLGSFHRDHWQLSAWDSEQGGIFPANGGRRRVVVSLPVVTEALNTGIVTERGISTILGATVEAPDVSGAADGNFGTLASPLAPLGGMFRHAGSTVQMIHVPKVTGSPTLYVWTFHRSDIGVDSRVWGLAESLPTSAGNPMVHVVNLPGEYCAFTASGASTPDFVVTMDAEFEVG